MSQTKSGTTAEQLVSGNDHVQLSRLVTEHAWRVDNGRADTIQELYVDDGELTLPPGPMRGRDALRAWGRRIVLTVMVAGEQASTTVPFSVGEDHDWFVRTQQGWRFVSRRWVELFARGDTLNLPGNKSGLRFR